ncbi:MAG: sigma-54 interaction domain-containing protein [Bacillota bacterium]
MATTPKDALSGGPMAFAAGASAHQPVEVSRFLAEFGLRNVDDLKAYIRRLETAVNLSAMADSLPPGAGGGVSIVNTAGHILRADGEFAKRRGVAPENLAGRDIRQVLEEMNSGRVGCVPRSGPDGEDRPDDDLVTIHGQSKEIMKAKQLAQRAAATDLTVLLTGESGTGKELFARAIHQMSPRAVRPFVALNCAAIPESLMEAEVFGYAAGAFTGARKGGKPGRFELAHQGTIFLDEVGDLAPALQAKLLRVLQEGEIEKIGATAPVRVDVRVIAATNKNLGTMAETGRFRKDLYYRLNVLRVHLPTLRDRPQDIPILAAIIIDRYNRRYAGLAPKALTPEAMDLLTRYSWPGNIRELQNTLRTVFSTEDAPEIRPEHLPAHLQQLARVPRGVGQKTLDKVVEEVEREMIAEALRATGGNRAKSARLLGLPRSSFYEKLERYGLGHEPEQEVARGAVGDD